MVKIDGFGFGELKIDGKTYYSDVIVWWDGKVELVAKTHKISERIVSRALEGGAEVLVIGTGEQGAASVSSRAMDTAESSKVKVYTDPTSKAVDMFNGLVAQGKKAAGFFHVTC